MGACSHVEGDNGFMSRRFVDRFRARYLKAFLGAENTSELTEATLQGQLSPHTEELLDKAAAGVVQRRETNAGEVRYALRKSLISTVKLCRGARRRKGQHDTVGTDMRGMVALWKSDG